VLLKFLFILATANLFGSVVSVKINEVLNFGNFNEIAIDVLSPGNNITLTGLSNTQWSIDILNGQEGLVTGFPVNSLGVMVGFTAATYPTTLDAYALLNGIVVDSVKLTTLNGVNFTASALNFGTYQTDFPSSNTTPEPSSFILGGLGTLGILGLAHWRQRQTG
jgi:hypothetical protein